MKYLTGLQFPWMGKILGSLLAILVTYLIVVLVRRLIRKVVHEPAARYPLNKRISYISFVIAIVVIAMIWAESLGSLTTMLGLLSAGLALALKDSISSLVGWFYISGSKIYQLGDRIQIGELKGDVVDISMMTTTVVEIGNWVIGEQSTGRIVRIPNNWVFVREVFNYTEAFPFIWTEVAFLITFESDWKKAAEIMQEAMTEVVGDLPKQVETSMEKAKEYLLIHYRKYTPIVYIRVIDSGVQLIGRFLTQVRKRRGLESELTKKILDEFDSEKNISLAYTTYRIVK